MKRLLAIVMLLLTLSLTGCGKQAEQAEIPAQADESNAANAAAQSAESTKQLETPGYVTFRQEMPATVVGAWPTRYGQYFMRIQVDENKASPRVFDYTSSEKFAFGQKVNMALNVRDEVVGLTPA